MTRRHLDFLFNREETVVTDSHVKAMEIVRRIAERDSELLDRLADHQLPPSDESKVGDDV